MGRITLQGALRFDHAFSYSPEQTIGPALDQRPDVPGDAAHVRPHRRRQLQGHLAARRRGVRRLRQRQDGGQDQRRQVRGSGEQPEQQLLDQQPDRAHRDRRRPARGPTTAPAAWNARLRRQHSAVRPHATTPRTASAPPRTPQRSARRRGRRRRSIRTLLNGWGIRPNDWQIGASVQQQLMPRVSVEVGYFKRWLQNFTATDNTLVTAGDFTPFSITAPSDPRLPGGGGYTDRRTLQRRPRRSSARRRTTSRTPANFGDAVPELQRHPGQHQRPREQGPDVPGRHQHRQDREGQLRRSWPRCRKRSPDRSRR